MQFCAYVDGEEKEGSGAFPNWLLKGALLSCWGFLQGLRWSGCSLCPGPPPWPPVIPGRRQGPASVNTGPLSLETSLLLLTSEFFPKLWKPAGITWKCQGVNTLGVTPPPIVSAEASR